MDPNPNYYDKSGACAISIKLFCRRMEGYENYPLTHCYLGIFKDGKLIETVSGQRDARPKSPTCGRTICSLDPDWEMENHNRPECHPTKHSLAYKGSPCLWINCIKRYANYISGMFPYDQNIDNSNTFLTRIIRFCGGYALFPPSAIGSDNIIPSGVHQTEFPPPYEVGNPCNGGLFCFESGTLVATPNGNREIQTIHSGELVYAYDFEANQVVERRVIKCHSRDTNEIIDIRINDTIVHTTSEHPFYVIDKGWVKVSALRKGDCLMTKEKKNVSIGDITSIRRNTCVYNLTVAGNENYFISSKHLLVHNKPV
jgi:hypothetical protein